MRKCEVYMHGQVPQTHSFLLRDGFLGPAEAERGKCPVRQMISGDGDL